MAASGIAATLIPGGRTIHSKLGVPLKLHEKSELPLDDLGPSFKKLIKATELLVFDEVTMADKLIYECIDRSFRRVKEKDEPFGGITCVFSGDWR